jgi:hypothetical protein
MPIGMWLIAKGFNSSAFVSQPEDTGYIPGKAFTFYF